MGLDASPRSIHAPASTQLLLGKDGKAVDYLLLAEHAFDENGIADVADLSLRLHSRFDVVSFNSGLDRSQC